MPDLFERPKQPTIDLPALFHTEDYPLEAIRNEEQGTTAVVVRVAADGRVTDCIVSNSSGSSSLDLQTCRIFWTRARFEPARDSKGRPVESAVRQRVRWELPESDPMPFKAWSARYFWEFVENGGLISCRAELSGALKGQGGDCGIALDIWQSALANLRTNAGYKRRTLVFDVQFAPDNRPAPEKQPDGTQLIGRQVARLTIDANGATRQCQVVESVGLDPSVGCDDLLGNYFEMPANSVSGVQATIVRTGYLGD